MNKTTKTIILGLLSIIGMLIFGWMNQLVFLDNFSLTMRIILFIWAFILGLGFWGLMAYLIDKRPLAQLISFLSTLILLIFIPLNSYYIICLILLFLFFICYYEKIQSEKKARIKTKLDETISPSLKSITMILCLIMALNYYYSPLSQQIKIDLPENYQEKIFNYVFPGFNWEMTVDDLIYIIMAKNEQVPKNQIPEYISKKRSGIDPQYFSSYKKTILERLGISDLGLSGQERIKDLHFWNRVVNDRVEEYLQKYVNLFHFISTLLFFITITWLWKIAYPLILLLIWVLFKLMLKTGFVTVTKEQVSAEKTEL